MADAVLSGKGIAYVHWGNSWQLRSFQDFRHYIDDLIYIHDLPRVDLSLYAAVVVPDAMDAAALQPYAQQLNAYLKGGGFLVVCLQGHADWLDIPGLTWTPGKLPRLAVVDERRKAGGAAFCAASPDHRKHAAVAYELALGRLLQHSGRRALHP